jgi:hypothetical protein
VKLCGHAGALLVFVLSLATSRAAAAGPLSIEARPILGTEVPAGAGWLSVALHVRNATAQPVSGKLELVAETQLYGRGRLSKQSKAPYAVPARGSVLVRLPISGSGAFPSLTARALDENGNVLAETALTGLRAEAPLLFDLSPVSRVAPALRGAIVQGTPAAGRAPQTVFSLAVGTPDIERASGDPILPERAPSCWRRPPASPRCPKPSSERSAIGSSPAARSRSALPDPRISSARRSRR